MSLHRSVRFHQAGLCGSYLEASISWLLLKRILHVCTEHHRVLDRRAVHGDLYVSLVFCYMLLMLAFALLECCRVKPFRHTGALVFLLHFNNTRKAFLLDNIGALTSSIKENLHLEHEIMRWNKFLTIMMHVHEYIAPLQKSAYCAAKKLPPRELRVRPCKWYTSVGLGDKFEIVCQRGLHFPDA